MDNSDISQVSRARKLSKKASQNLITLEAAKHEGRQTEAIAQIYGGVNFFQLLFAVHVVQRLTRNFLAQRSRSSVTFQKLGDAKLFRSW